MDATSLPPTCGEVMEIPGTPSIGCVAVLEHRMNTPDGFSCCVVASQEEVYILGPNLKMRDNSLISVRLWRPRAETKVTRMVSLVAFFLHLPTDEPSGLFLNDNAVSVTDEVCVVTVWEDVGRQQQHITVLIFPLLSVLSTASNASVVVRETFFQTRGQQRLLRLFYHPFFSLENCRHDHVVLCSCYNESTRKNAPLTLSESRDSEILTPGDPRGVLSGSFSFVVVSASLEVPCGWGVEWVVKPPACVAPWLLGGSCDDVVCAVAVRPEVSGVIAAFGTTKGRLIFLRRDGSCETHRLGGPIADLAFVDTRRIKGDDRYRRDAITELFQNAKKTVCCDPNKASEPKMTEGAWMSLVVLDSLGRVVVFRNVGLGTEIMQGVPDVQQFITLAGHRTRHTSSSCVTEEPEGARPAAVSSKSFFDLSSLRLFFQRRRQKGQETEIPNNKTCPTLTHDADALRQPTREDTMFAGHILSRGLLSLASVPGPKGHVELVVGTMGQSIVSIPYDAKEDVFSIATFIEAPEPMFFIAFVDFFNTGVSELVMAGKQHVLVARRSRCQQVFRSALLLRLLAKKMRNITLDVEASAA